MLALSDYYYVFLKVNSIQLYHSKPFLPLYCYREVAVAVEK